MITDRDVCFDGSSEIKLAQGGDCGEDLKCKALGVKYAGETSTSVIRWFIVKEQKMRPTAIRKQL